MYYILLFVYYCNNTQTTNGWGGKYVLNLVQLHVRARARVQRGTKFSTAACPTSALNLVYIQVRLAPVFQCS